MSGDLARQDVTPYTKAGQVPPKKAKRTSASRARIAEIRAKKAMECRLCGAWQKVNAHHLIPRSLGGVWTESNIVGLCGSGTTGCHGDVEARHPDALYRLRASLTDAEYSYVVEKAGEGFLERYYPIRATTANVARPMGDFAKEETGAGGAG